MTKSLLAVFGATGQQGGSVISNVLQDPELSQRYEIRAITRDPNSDKARQIAEKVNVVQADLADRASLEKALTGVKIVFVMTVPAFAPGTISEFDSIKTIADISLEQGVEYIISSTLPHAIDISDGKYKNLINANDKAEAERYIRGLNIKSAFFSPGWFMENFKSVPFLAPQKQSDGTWAFLSNVPASTKWPMIAIVPDTGKYIGAILAEPDKYNGKTFCASTAMYSLADVAAIMTHTTGKTVTVKEVSDEDFKASIPFGPEIFSELFRFTHEYGYYGPQTDKEVAWAAENARGKLTTIEEFLQGFTFA